MNILFIGDIVGSAGRDFTAKVLPKLKRTYQPDFIIANGENLASGKGITPRVYNEMMNLGIDLLTGGNHTLARDNIFEIIDKPETNIIRPYNWPKETPGRGYQLIKRNRQRLLVVNLQGQVFIEDSDANSPFMAIDDFLKNDLPTTNILVDFHAEATSEKRALAEYAGNRVSAFIGTHTHVLTNDSIIINKHTGFISDAGMTGAVNSVIGVKTKLVLERFLTGSRNIFEVETEGPMQLNAVAIELGRGGACKKIEPIRIVE